MTNDAKMQAEIYQLEKKIIKINKSLPTLKPELRAVKSEEMIQYQKRIDELKKQLSANDDLYQKDYMRHVVPIKSNIVEVDETTAVLKTTEDEIINKPISPISGTEVLFMNPNRREREKDYQLTLQNTLMLNLNRQTDNNQSVDLIQKLNIVNTNLSKLEAALK